MAYSDFFVYNIIANYLNKIIANYYLKCYKKG